MQGQGVKGAQGMKRLQGSIRGSQNSGGSNAMAQLEKQRCFKSGKRQTVRIPVQFRCEERGLYPAATSPVPESGQRG